jgi:hypothetical protein
VFGETRAGKLPTVVRPGGSGLTLVKEPCHGPTAAFSVQ